MSKFIIFVLFMVITAFSANATTQNDIAPYFTDIPETNKNSNLQSSIPDLTDSDSLSESNFEPLHLSGVTESLNDRIYRVNETNVYFNETDVKSYQATQVGDFLQLRVNNEIVLASGITIASTGLIGFRDSPTCFN